MNHVNLPTWTSSRLISHHFSLTPPQNLLHRKIAKSIGLGIRKWWFSQLAKPSFHLAMSAMWWVHPSKQPTVNSVCGKNIGQVSHEQEVAKAFGKCWLAASWLNFADSPDLIWLIQGKSELKVGEFRDDFFVLRFTKRAGERFKAPGIFPPPQKGPATFSQKKVPISMAWEWGSFNSTCLAAWLFLVWETRHGLAKVVLGKTSDFFSKSFRYST